MKVSLLEPDLRLECRFRDRNFTIFRDDTDEWYILVWDEESGMADYDGWWPDSQGKSMRDAMREACRGSLVEPPKRWPPEVR